MFVPRLAAGHASLAALATLVAGCGGGGDSSGTTGSVIVAAPASSPTPSPAPTPTPSSAATVRAPFGLTASQPLFSLGWFDDHRGAGPVERSIDLRWSATLGTYETTLPDVGSGRLAFTFPGRNDYAFSLIGGNGAPLPVAISLDDGRFHDPAYRTAGILVWGREFPNYFIEAGQVAFGLPSTAADLPANRVTYLTDNSALFTFDFAAASFAGYVRLAWVDAWGPYPPSQYSLTQTAYSRGAASFTARFTVPGAPREGVVRGQFMGPRAEELAIAWRGPVRNPYTEEWETHSGVSLGRVCADCPPRPSDSAPKTAAIVI